MDLTVYEHALDLWSKADLTTLQQQLDKDVIDIKEKETQFLESRKALASETKKFKKLSAEEKLSHLNKIIKQYQQEIDSLTKRSKTSEVIILDLYGKISEAPDPKPLLHNSVEKLSKIDDSKALKERIDILEDKLAKYADYENIKSRLLDLEQNSAVTLVKRLTAKEQEVNSKWEERQRNWDERELELSRQLDSLRSKNETLTVTTPNQGDVGTKGQEIEKDSDASRYVGNTEYSLLEQELESAQTRVFQLEKRNEELNGALAKANSTVEQELQLQSKETKIKQLESENALLSAASEHDHKTHKTLETDLREQLKNLQAETDSYKSEIKSIRLKLDNYSDYNKLKEELSALKRIEFGTDQSEGEDSDGGENISSNGKVESSIVSANKKLQGSLAALRGKFADSEEENTSLKKQITALKDKLTETEILNRKLEADLENIEEVDQKFNDTASMMSGVTRQMNNRTGKLSPTSSIVGIPEETEVPITFGNSTILPIITKQRDRLRQRNTELEKQVRQSGNDKTKLKNEISKLKSDNTKLYERIRYLSRFSGNTGDASAYDMDAEAQYSRVYEDSLNPLNNLKKKEMEYYKKNRLSILEKLFLSFARIILANKTTRIVFLFYCIGVHALIFMMSVYVINLSGYLTPEVGIVQSSTSSRNQNLNGGAAGMMR